MYWMPTSVVSGEAASVAVSVSPCLMPSTSSPSGTATNLNCTLPLLLPAPLADERVAFHVPRTSPRLVPAVNLKATLSLSIAMSHSPRLKPAPTSMPRQYVRLLRLGLPPHILVSAAVQ